MSDSGKRGRSGFGRAVPAVNVAGAEGLHEWLGDAPADVSRVSIRSAARPAFVSVPASPRRAGTPEHFSRRRENFPATAGPALYGAYGKRGGPLKGSSVPVMLRFPARPGSRRGRDGGR